MLGIDQETTARIAQMPTEHSWLLPMLTLDEWQVMKAQVNLENWLDKIADKIYPDSNPKVSENSTVMWAVSRFLPNILESRAIWKFLEERPGMLGAIQLIDTPEDAAAMANMEHNGYLKEEEQEQIVKILQTVVNEDLQMTEEELLKGVFED